MNGRSLKGIALILFGILLCAGGSDINSTVLYSFSDFPFSIIGVLFGIAGLAVVFLGAKEKDK